MRAVGFGLVAIYQCTAQLLLVAVGFIAWILGNLFFVRDYQQIKKADSAVQNSTVCLIATVCLLSTWSGSSPTPNQQRKSETTR